MLPEPNRRSNLRPGPPWLNMAGTAEGQIAQALPPLPPKLAEYAALLQRAVDADREYWRARGAGEQWHGKELDAENARADVVAWQRDNASDFMMGFQNAKQWSAPALRAIIIDLIAQDIADAIDTAQRGRR